MIPEFNNLTHSYSLPAVSVFTAELLAISMALQHISAIPVTPFAIVICSDSKAALAAIKFDSQNAREDLVREIATTTHQLITRGTEVRFQWVPAHVCL
ncbi:MAG: RNAse HI domain-containing protein, partial [Sulfurovum sp.]|nr:RNAse HI domain-containing protein [Sulfurovum sp.]